MRFRKQVIINASPEAIFGIISDLPTFAGLSRYIERITVIDDKQACWSARICGIPLEWDALVTDNRPPVRFAWKSTSGVRNSGTWRLRPVDGGTCVDFGMTFHLPGGMDFLLDNRVFRQFVNDLTGEILANLEKLLATK